MGQLLLVNLLQFCPFATHFWLFCVGFGEFFYSLKLPYCGVIGLSASTKIVNIKLCDLHVPLLMHDLENTSLEESLEKVETFE